MSLYHYRAYRADGRTLTGTLAAENGTALEARLREAGLWLLEARERHDAQAAAPEGASRLKLRRSDVIAFLLQMSLLLKAGVTLPRALERLAADAGERPLGQMIRTIHEQVTIGVPLHSALQQFPRVFPPSTVAMIEAGEASGRMAEVFASLTTYFEWLDQLMSDLRQALVYPIMVTTAALSFVLLLFTLVVPRFVGLLLDLQLEVPLLTRIVMAISNALLAGWPVWLTLGAGVPLAVRLALRVPAFACAWDRALMRLPIFGPLVAMFALSRFAQNLGILYAAGVPLLRGLEITRGLVGNRAVAQALTVVRQRMQEGTPLHRCLADDPIFPPAIVTMVATGETSGSLDVALQSVADYYNKLLPRRIKLVLSIFDPLAMFSLIAVVAVVALAVILPILQLWNVR